MGIARVWCVEVIHTTSTVVLDWRGVFCDRVRPAWMIDHYVGVLNHVFIISSHYLFSTIFLLLAIRLLL